MVQVGVYDDPENLVSPVVLEIPCSQLQKQRVQKAEAGIHAVGMLLLRVDPCHSQCPNGQINGLMFSIG